MDIFEYYAVSNWKMKTQYYKLFKHVHCENVSFKNVARIH